jgi:endoglucanase
MTWAAGAMTASGGVPAGKVVTARAVCSAPAGHAVAVAGPQAGQAAGRAPAEAPGFAIRVDQLGYPARAAKLAEIMVREQPQRSGPPQPVQAIGWELIRQGTCAVVGHGFAGFDLGRWSSKYPAVLAITFSRFRTPGTYRLALTKHPSVVSPWFSIGAPPGLYATALANALSFYQNERDGPDYIASALRTVPGHLNDANAMTFRIPKVNGNGNFRGSLRRFATGVRINATGGWFDAGDYLHFTETTSYTVAMLLQGIASFPRRMGAGGQASFADEAKFGLDFLQRMWNEQAKTLYLQVGTGEANNYYFGDHDIWRMPQADDDYMGTNPHYLYIRHPPVFRAGRPGAKISPNLAGRLAADFALCYRVFRVSDPAYAARCLRSAETVYSLAGTHWKGQIQTTIPWDFYPETSWRDDMMLGATELALALRPSSQAGHEARLPAGLPVKSASVYLADAARWANQWINGKGAVSDTLNLYDVSALADYELYRAIGHGGGSSAGHGAGSGPASLAITRAALLANLRAQIQRAIGIGAKDPFGFGFSWNQWDTTTHGLGMSVMADEYDALVHRPAYAAWGQRQLDNVLGANPWGVSLIVGDGTVFPDCMQHQVANLAGSHNGTTPVLAGAVVEGPNSYAATGTVPNMQSCVANAPGDVSYAAFNGEHAVFADNVQSFSTVEPAIDLTALSPLAFAWQESAGQGGY